MGNCYLYLYYNLIFLALFSNFFDVGLGTIHVLDNNRWEFSVSFSAKEFIRQLMCKDPKKRFSCKQAIAFPWYVFFTLPTWAVKKNNLRWTGPEVIKHFSISPQLSIKFILLIKVKMPAIVGILTFMSRKNDIRSWSEPEKCWISWYFFTYEHLKFHV